MDKQRIPLPKKTEKTHKDKTKYTRKKKHKEDKDPYWYPKNLIGAFN